MQEYYFLFTLAFIWIIFAVAQDLRTREVSNWLNFSLIAIVLAYRAFYSVYTKDLMFFVYGAGGILLFVGLAYMFYYGRVFAGGDAKLLMGLGGVLPYEMLGDYLYLGFGFILLLFSAGAIYTLFYSLMLIPRNKKKFIKDFKSEFNKRKGIFYSVIVLAILFELILLFLGSLNAFWWFGIIIFLMPLLFFYTKALEKSCMIILKDAKELSEGEWLEKDVKVGNKLIKKSVHGLSIKDIKLLRKYKKKVWIKDGVPFTPAFLFAFIIVLIYLVKG